METIKKDQKLNKTSNLTCKKKNKIDKYLPTYAKKKKDSTSKITWDIIANTTEMHRLIRATMNNYIT